jgi:hypothetical protein
MVVGDPEHEYDLYRTNRCLVAEVVSPDTQTTDRRDELFTYRQPSTLQTYLIV